MLIYYEILHKRWEALQVTRLTKSKPPSSCATVVDGVVVHVRPTQPQSHQRRPPLPRRSIRIVVRATNPSLPRRRRPSSRPSHTPPPPHPPPAAARRTDEPSRLRWRRRRDACSTQRSLGTSSSSRWDDDSLMSPRLTKKLKLIQKPRRKGLTICHTGHII